MSNVIVRLFIAYSITTFI